MTEIKYEYRKKEKNIYLPKQEPVIINIPTFKYITVKGKGSPRETEFSNCIEALYSVSYAIRMMPKKGIEIKDYYLYTVYPLEGIWDLSDKGRNSKVLLKEEFIYTLMIRQPDFVTEKVFLEAIKIVKKKKNIFKLDELKFESITDGLSVQMMHIGSFDNEHESFSLMHDFLKRNNYKIKNLAHREIYLSDFRKVKTEKLKTVLRYTLEKKEEKNV